MEKIYKLQQTNLTISNGDRFDRDPNCKEYETIVEAETPIKIIQILMNQLNNDELYLDNSFLRLVTPKGEVLNG